MVTLYNLIKYTSQVTVLSTDSSSGRKFGAKDKLRDHVYTHTGERPYNCDKCDYGTAKKFNLDQHKERKHQGGHSMRLIGFGYYLWFSKTVFD